VAGNLLDGKTTVIAAAAAADESVGLVAWRAMVVQLATQSQVTGQTLDHRNVARQELHVVYIKRHIARSIPDKSSTSNTALNL